MTIAKAIIRFIFTPALVLIIFLTLLAAQEKKQTPWKLEKYTSAQAAGFSKTKLEEARAYYLSGSDTAGGGLVIIYKSKVLAEWGDYSKNINMHSARKSLLSALYGIYVDRGYIDLELTIDELGIDDEPPLTEAEKQAKMIHLLKARSGIYHAAAAETQEMRDARPPRGSHAPDTFWYYNNWDFNALGTIFIQETGEDIFEAFDTDIARLIGMEDFSTDFCQYNYEYQYSIHPQYAFRMSARDRARFGLLFIQNGRWGEAQIVPSSWVKESTRSYSDASSELPHAGYGYMWWVLPKEAFASVGVQYMGTYYCYLAAGYGGQDIFVIPEADMVVAFAVDTDRNMDMSMEFGVTTIEMLFAAKEFEINDLAVLKIRSNKKKFSPGEAIKLSAKVRNLSRDTSETSTVEFYLSKDRTFDKHDTFIGEATLKQIKAGKKTAARVKSSNTSALSPGGYYIIAVVDKQDKNSDPHFDNNTSHSAKKIRVR